MDRCEWQGEETNDVRVDSSENSEVTSGESLASDEGLAGEGVVDRLYEERNQ